jgi:hypothetical protein
MKTKTTFQNSLRITLIAIIMAVFTASLLPFNGNAASISNTTNQDPIINTTGNLVEKSMDAKLLHSKMAATVSAQTGASDASVIYQPAEVAIAEGINDIAAPVVEETVAETAPVYTFPSLENFAAQVTNGNGGQITGLYSDNLFALSVVQQPSGQAGYVATSGNTATQFGMASGLGFLAHNYLSGSMFFYLYSGSPIAVVYGDGRSQTYRVTQIRKFQALSPDSPYSDFVDLASGSSLSGSDLFSQIYGVGGQVVLQTCISSEGISSWGRLFVIATPSN